MFALSILALALAFALASAFAFAFDMAFDWRQRFGGIPQLRIATWIKA